MNCVKKFTFLSYFSTHSGKDSFEMGKFFFFFAVRYGNRSVVEGICTFWIRVRSTHPAFYTTACKQTKQIKLWYNLCTATAHLQHFNWSNRSSQKYYIKNGREQMSRLTSNLYSLCFRITANNNPKRMIGICFAMTLFINLNDLIKWLTNITRIYWEFKTRP